MLAFLPEGLVLLAVPKTGTTALANVLGPRATMMLRQPLKHLPLERFNRQVLPLLESAASGPIETIAVLREPVDWLGSWYRYRARPDLIGHRNSTEGMSFDAFVTAYASRKPPACAAVGSQARYVFGRSGERGVTHLFRHDRSEELVRFLEERLDRAIELPRSNVSPVLPTPLSPDVEELLRRQRPDEFRAWAEVSGAS
jgi:hypothetical protein